MFNFLMKKALKHKMKDVPPEQQEMLMKLVEKDPQFFQKMAEEIKEKTKGGLDEQTAAMQVMMKHKDKLQDLAKGI